MVLSGADLTLTWPAIASRWPRSESASLPSTSLLLRPPLYPQPLPHRPLWWSTASCHIPYQLLPRVPMQPASPGLKSIFSLRPWSGSTRWTWGTLLTIFCSGAHNYTKHVVTIILGQKLKIVNYPIRVIKEFGSCLIPKVWKSRQETLWKNQYKTSYFIASVVFLFLSMILNNEFC